MRFLTTAIAVGMVATAGWMGTEASAGQAPGATGASFAYVDIQRVATESTEGQAATARVDELSQEKLAEIEARNTEGQEEVAALNQELQDAQQDLQQGQNVISADATATLQRQMTRLQRDIERTTADAQADIQRMSQDAEIEVQELQQQLQAQFEQRLVPAIDQLATEQGLSFIFSAQQGLVWADPSLDVTQALIDLVNSDAPDTSSP